MSADDDFAMVQKAYRRARWTLIGHAVFLGGGLLFATVVRRAAGLPPALLGVAIIVALVLFGGDIMKFLRLRDRLRQLGSE
jgi:hypothetical protein